MSIAPPAVVEGQPRTGLPFGLFSVLSPRGEGDGRWQNGIEWEALSCEPAGGRGEDSCDPDEETIGLPKEIVRGNSLGTASPFTVYGSHVCTPVGRDSTQYAQERATEHLLAREEARAEQALWTGDLGSNEFTSTATSVGSGLSMTRAIAALERWLATSYGSLGVIHMTREAATVALEKGVVRATGQRLNTVLGTPVVAGAGYPGTGPDGSEPAEGSTYIYATPALLGYRSEIFAGAEPVTAGFDRQTNDLSAVAERTYVIGYDPCGSAVVGVTYESGGSAGVGVQNIVDNGDGTFALALTDGSTTDPVELIPGPQGDPGAPGAPGAPGDPGDPGAPGADGVVQAVVAGDGVTVDSTDPANPIISTEGA